MGVDDRLHLRPRLEDIAVKPPLARWAVVGVISMPSPWRRLIFPDVPWLMPSTFMRRHASMID